MEFTAIDALMNVWTVLEFRNPGLYGMGKGPAAVILPPGRCWSWQAAFPKQLPGGDWQGIGGF